MSTEFNANVLQFLCELPQYDEADRVEIGSFKDIYKIIILKHYDDVPCYYLEYDAEDEFDCVLYKFNFLDDNFIGFGEFNEGKMLKDFVEINYQKMIEVWNDNNEEQLDLDIPFINFAHNFED